MMMMRATALPAVLRCRSIPRSLVRTTVVCRDLTTSSPRRRRPPPSGAKYKLLGQEEQSRQPDRGGLQHAFAPSEDNFDDYLKKASLSPWVPVPDPVARKMLEIAKAGPDDIHVELGSGDGRVNFHAFDPPFTVKKSIGVDIDEKLVGVAQERLSKRHPQPENLIFRVEDMVESRLWEQDIQEATIVTMYFVQDALLKLKPKLEAALKDRKCRIVCCGYAMPDWEPRWVEVILDLPIYLYTYNTPIDELPSLTAAERAKLMATLQVQDVQEEVPLSEEKVFPKGQFDDVEEIEVPLFDPNEMIDGHWDDFDEEEEEDLDGNPAISKWRKPE